MLPNPARTCGLGGRAPTMGHAADAGGDSLSGGAEIDSRQHKHGTVRASGAGATGRRGIGYVGALLAGLVAAVLASCAPIPEGAAIRRSEVTPERRALPWPQLQPIDDVIAAASRAGATPDPGPAAIARMRSLRARAAELRQDVLSPVDRARMEAAIRRRNAAVRQH